MPTIITYFQFNTIARQVGRSTAVDSAKNMTRFTRLDSQRTVPIDKGLLHRSVASNVDRGPGGAVGRVQYRTDYAAAVHEGARPHVITPRKGSSGALSFVVGGRRIVTNRVNHPGNRSNPWLWRALQRQGALRNYRTRRTPASRL